MANVTSTAEVRVETSQAQASLARLQASLDKTNNALGGLKSIIGSIAIASFIRGAFGMADAMSDLGDATGISTARLLGFTNAVASNGGSIEGASKSLLKLTENIGNAADGSGILQDAFMQVGVSLKDLGTLSEEDLLKKTIDGLAKVGDVSARSRLQVALLGKGFAGVNAVAVAQGFDAATISSEKSATAIRAAGDTMDKLSDTLRKLQQEALIAIKPLVDGFNKIPMDTLVNVIKLLTQIALALVAWAYIPKLIGLVVIAWKTFGATLASVGTSVTAISGSMIGLGRVLRGSTRDLTNGVLTYEKFSGVTLPKFISRVGNLAGALISLVSKFALVAVAVKIVNDTFAALTGYDPIDKMAKSLERMVKEYMPGLHSSIDELGKKLGMADVNGNAQATPESTSADQNAAAAALWESIKARKAEKQAIRDTVDGFIKQKAAISAISDEYNKNNKKIMDAILLDTKLIGTSKQNQDIQRAQADLISRTKDEIDKLTRAKEGLNAVELRAGLGKAYDIEINQIKRLAATEKDRLESNLKLQNQAQEKEQKNLFGVTQRIQSENSLRKIQDEMATMTLPEIEKQYFAINAAARESAKAAIDAEEARRGSALSPDEAKAYYAEAIKGTNSLREATQAAYEQSRTFQTGWKQAMQEFVDDSTNAANQARLLFSSLVNAFDSAFDQMVRTGKVQWNSLIQEMIITMMKSDMHRMFAGMFSGGGSRGGNGFAGGFAGGGDIPAGGYGIVGEFGPEYISGPAKITPMQKGSGSTAPTQITYQISAVDAKSFQQLIAQDPAFLHAVVSKGARSTGGR